MKINLHIVIIITPTLSHHRCRPERQSKYLPPLDLKMDVVSHPLLC